MSERLCLLWPPSNHSTHICGEYHPLTYWKRTITTLRSAAAAGHQVQIAATGVFMTNHRRQPASAATPCKLIRRQISVTHGNSPADYDYGAHGDTSDQHSTIVTMRKHSAVDEVALKKFYIGTWQ
jgi:hypothetical protein